MEENSPYLYHKYIGLSEFDINLRYEELDEIPKEPGISLKIKKQAISRLLCTAERGRTSTG